jgi:hypothetical protein
MSEYEHLTAYELNMRRIKFVYDFVRQCMPQGGCEDCPYKPECAGLHDPIEAFADRLMVCGSRKLEKEAVKKAVIDTGTEKIEKDIEGYEHQSVFVLKEVMPDGSIKETTLTPKDYKRLDLGHITYFGSRG